MLKGKLYLIILCTLSFISIILVSEFVFQFFPFSGDEYSYIFQSKIFKTGKLYYNSPSNPEFFELHHVINEGKWHSKYTFGWPLVLFLGEVFNIGWIVNPLIGILTLAVLFYFTAFLFNKNVAYISVFLMAISPFFIFNSSSYFPHALSLLFSITFLFFYFLTLKNGRLVYSFAAGLSLAILFFIRPIDSFIVIAPITIFSIIELSKNKKLLKALFIILAVFSIFSPIPLHINYVLTGSPLKFSYQVYNPDDTLGLFKENAFTKGMQNTKHHFKFLFFWLPLTIFFVPFAKYDKIKLLLLSILLLNISAYFFYHSPGGDQFGPRYYYTSFLSIVILASSAINKIKINKKLVISLLFLINISLNVYFAYDIHQEVLFRKQVYDYAKEQNIHNSIIFLKSTKEQGCAWYTRNSPALDDDNLFVCDLDSKNQELIKSYPNRKIRFYDLKDMGQPTSNYHRNLVW